MSFNSGTAKGLSDFSDLLLQSWGWEGDWLFGWLSVDLWLSFLEGVGGRSPCRLVCGEVSGCCWLSSILEESGVGRNNGDTISNLSNLLLTAPRPSFGGSFGGEGSVKECFVAVVSTEYRAAEESSVP